MLKAVLRTNPITSEHLSEATGFLTRLGYDGLVRTLCEVGSAAGQPVDPSVYEPGRSSASY
jgi:hypothetical protein